VLLDLDDVEVRTLVVRYVDRLELPTERLRVTTKRAEFERWLGRRIGSALGGAYVYLARHQEHAILINLARIDRARPRAVEIVVAEELIHMRDHLDGDRRRHAKHGYDRIALRVAELTGASLEEVRSCLLPVRRRSAHLLYACPACGQTVTRRRRGTWSCGRCAPRFDRRFVLRLVAETRETNE
jgi:predicted SprT family Zn-dependent metalloprotease